MRFLRALLLLILTLAAPAQGQGTQYLMVSQRVASELTARWDESRDSMQTERAYCVSYSVVRNKQRTMTVYIADSMTAALHQVASVYSLTFDCPDRPNVVALHTHPPTTCAVTETTPLKCRWGGPDAYECYPSATDQRALDRSGDPFALIQCDRHAIVPVFRDPLHIPELPRLFLAPRAPRRVALTTLVEPPDVRRLVTQAIVLLLLSLLILGVLMVQV